MRSIFGMPSDDMPPNEGEGALPKEEGKCEAFLECLPIKEFKEENVCLR